MEGLTTTMSKADKFLVDNEVAGYNKTLGAKGRGASHSLGKDDFLKLLIKQMTTQDPLNPMDNTQFVSQMAQFSSLEQMTNMNSEFGKLSAMFKSSEAQNVVGREVELSVGDATEKGVVQAATREENPRVLVNGRYYSMEQVSAVYGN